MEKKYMVIVYRNRRSLNDYGEFTNKERQKIGINICQLKQNTKRRKIKIKNIIY